MRVTGIMFLELFLLLEIHIQLLETVLENSISAEKGLIIYAEESEITFRIIDFPRATKPRLMSGWRATVALLEIVWNYILARLQRDYKHLICTPPEVYAISIYIWI